MTVYACRYCGRQSHSAALMKAHEQDHPPVVSDDAEWGAPAAPSPEEKETPRECEIR